MDILKGTMVICGSGPNNLSKHNFQLTSLLSANIALLADNFFSFLQNIIALHPSGPVFSAKGGRKKKF